MEGSISVLTQPPVLRITAPGRNYGKTWLATKLIGELTRRGVRVAALKHTHHPLPADRPGSDTDLFAAAGASKVAFCGPDGVLVRSPAVEDPFAEAVEALTGDADIVIVEGFKSELSTAEIELGGASPVVARLRDRSGGTLLVAPIDDVEGIAAAIERELLAVAPLRLVSTA